MLCNMNDINDDMLNKWYLYIIKVMLKLRLMNIINCHNDNIINKCIQIINLTVKEHKDLLSLTYYKIIRDFLLNWVAQLLKCFAIITILILNNVTLTDVVTDMLWTVKTIERI